MRLQDGATDRGIVLGDGSTCELAGIGADLASWVHILPDASCGALGTPLTDAHASVLAAAELADAYLPTAEGAAFTILVPAWGAIAPELEAPIELAAAAARAAMQVRIERWSAENRRVNIVRYVPPAGTDLGAFRAVDTLVARTPMHRLATTDELADAIDFLASRSASYITGSVLDLDGGWTAYSWFYPARDL